MIHIKWLFNNFNTIITKYNYPCISQLYCFFPTSNIIPCFLSSGARFLFPKPKKVWRRSTKMHRHKVKLLPSAWTELDEIADLHLQLVGSNSAQKITDKILNSLKTLKIIRIWEACQNIRFWQNRYFGFWIAENIGTFTKSERIP